MASAEDCTGRRQKSSDDVVNDLSVALTWTVDDWALLRKRALKSVADHIGVTNNDGVAHLLRLSSYTLQFLVLEHFILDPQAGEAAVALMLTCKTVYTSLSSAEHVWRPLLQRLANPGWFFAQQSPAVYFFARKIKWDLRGGVFAVRDEDLFDRFTLHAPLKKITLGYMKQVDSCICGGSLTSDDCTCGADTGENFEGCTCVDIQCEHSAVMCAMKALNKKKVRVRVRRALKRVQIQRELFQVEGNFHDVCNWPRVPDTTPSYSTLVHRYTPAYNEWKYLPPCWSGRCEVILNSYNRRRLERNLRPSVVSMYVLRISLGTICGSLLYKHNHWKHFKTACYSVLDGQGVATRKMFIRRRIRTLLECNEHKDGYDSCERLLRDISNLMTAWCEPNSVHVLEVNKYSVYDARALDNQWLDSKYYKDTW